MDLYFILFKKKNGYSNVSKRHIANNHQQNKILKH